MVDVNKAVVARLKKGNDVFEILVDCDKALLYREGKSKLEDAVAGPSVFKKARFGEHASPAEMKKIFGTEDPAKVADRILRDGEIQLTRDHKDKLREDKKKQVIALLARNAIDGRTGKPLPPARIEGLFDEARIKIDEFKSAEQQLGEIVKKLAPLAPIKIETRDLEIRIPALQAVKSFHALKSYGKVLKESWLNDGSLLATVEIPAGMQPTLEDELNKATKGNLEIKVVKKK